ncbi:hypothetical protein G5V65_11190 [Rhodobacter sp. HX-7-19]|uniref:Uncharacterized protein n=1 Tax=Paragemmobacter kunshanensis TaxID=2583234 RepID=A0A6M1U9W6_9RHOB|nr:hypothetical protein [Rhodobacter kunshanensis]NGQ91461.1 hypothetical protein [Rhodobacter kunshanensis]
MQIEEGKVYVTRDGKFHAGPMMKVASADAWVLERYPFMCSKTRLAVRADGRWRHWPDTEDHELDLVSELPTAP